MLFELSRHSDHHYMPGRKYQVLRNMDNAPQMPTGYPGMMLLATIPPLWFRVMHRHIRSLQLDQPNSPEEQAKERQKLAEMAAA
jgi:alkane 1-monooxygenase